MGGAAVLVYSVMMFLAGVPLAGISLAIYRGRTDLIHDYHQTKVADKTAYGKAFGKAMFVIPVTLLLSGIVGLLNDSEKTAMIAVAVLIAGLIVGIACITAVQKKFNNGVF